MMKVALGTVGALLLAVSGSVARGGGGECPGKPRQNVDVRVEVPETTIRAGRTILATASVDFEEEIHSLRIRTAGSGVLARSSRTTVVDGPWVAGSTYDHELSLATRGRGDGVARIHVDALDAEGRVRYTLLREVYALVRGSHTWASASSLTDVRLSRLTTLAAEGRLDANGLARAREAVSRSRPATDSRVRPAERMTAHERKLANAFPSSEKGGPKVLTTGIIVKGKAEWTDSADGKHGIPMAVVEIRDEDGATVSNLMGTTTTDAAGNYTATVQYDDGANGLPDVFVRVFARSPIADIKPDGAGTTTYFLQSPTQNEVAAGATVTMNFTAGKVADGETVFGVHHALVVIGAYAGQLAGTTPSQIDTRFPTTKSTSLFNGTQLHILKLDRFDWDVTHHEYGHYFMRVHAIQNNPGGKHGFSDNLASTRGSKDVGVRLAWGEGFPTWFGTVGQTLMGTAGLAIPNVGDTAYTDTEDSTNNVDLETSNGKGEDNEVSVMAALWDAFDGATDGLDVVSQTDKSIFNAVKGASSTTIGSAWNAIAGPQTTLVRTLTGAVFGQAKIAPELLTPAENYEDAGGAPPEFKWLKNGGGAPTPLNDFTIRFYKNDFSSVVFFKDLGDTDTFTPTPAEWATILGGDTLVKWVVEGRNTSNPETPGAGTPGRYWSAARTIGGISIAFVIDDTGSMGEEIAGVRTALQDFIDTVAAGLPPGAKPPTMQLVTFKDSVSVRLTTSDLPAMQTAVGGLFASGGGDCPEFGAQALAVAGGNVAAGGTILFATDASSQPGVDLGAVIASLRARGITVNVILSGDCAGIGTKPDENLVGGPDPDPRQFEAGKPDSDDGGEEAGGNITDPGQTPPDDHDNTSTAATVLAVGPERIRATIGATGDAADFFAVDLEAGVLYSITTLLESAASGVTTAILDTDGAAQLQSRFVSSTTIPGTMTFRPTVAGLYFVRVTRSVFNPTTSYLLTIEEDPLAELNNGIEMFSTFAFETGGAFLVHDEVNFGQSTGYVAGLYNAMVSTIQPTVLDGNPNDLPQGSTLSVSLQGRNTNWRTGATVAFSESGVTVQSVEVESATSLTCLVDVASDAPLTFRDVTVVSPFGTGSETATGRDVLEVTGPITIASILSVEPTVLSRGDTTTVTVRGAATTFADGVTVGLGAGITVGTVTVVSPTVLEVEVTVDDLAGIGFRTADTSDGALSKIRAVFVNAGALAVPQIMDVSPSEGSQGGTYNVMISAVNTHFVDGTTTASFGDGINVLDVDVTDETNAIVRVAVRPDAAVGFRDVQLTTGSEVAVVLDGFFVDDRPITVSALKKKGSIKGCIDSGSALGFTFTAAAGSTLKSVSVTHTKGPKLPAGGRGVLIPQISLIGPDGNEMVLAGPPAKRPDALVKDVLLPDAGMYTIVVQNLGTDPGCMKGSVKVKKP